jgi:hypothetical protein
LHFFLIFNNTSIIDPLTKILTIKHYTRMEIANLLVLTKTKKDFKTKTHNYPSQSPNWKPHRPPLLPLPSAFPEIQEPHHPFPTSSLRLPTPPPLHPETETQNLITPKPSPRKSETTTYHPETETHKLTHHQKIRNQETNQLPTKKMKPKPPTPH